MNGKLAHPADHGHGHDHGHEPGVTIARRQLLWMPVAFAGAALSQGTPAVPASAAFAPLSRDELGERWRALGVAIEALTDEHDESFAAHVVALLARTPLAALPVLGKPRPAIGVAGGPSWQLLPCLAIEFQMAPGAEIRLHNHPPQIVVSLCAEGEVRARHFELHGDAPPCTQLDGELFMVQETRSLLLRPGQTTSFTRRRDGMHGFVAGDAGARLIDFATFLSDDGETFSYVTLSDEPLDEERRLWEASWAGKK